MFETLQPYSILWITALLALAVAAILLRNNPRPQDFIAFGGIFAVLVFVYFIIRPTATPLMEESAQVQAAIGKGKPVLLEFQSPY